MTTTPSDNAGLADDELREILAVEYERAGSPHTAQMIRTLDPRAIQHPSTVAPLAAMRRVSALRPSVWMDISTVPKGWKLVPEEPTKEMLNAACGAMSPGKRPTPERVSCKAKHGIRYRAMLESAPTPPKAPTP